MSNHSKITSEQFLSKLKEGKDHFTMGSKDETIIVEGDVLIGQEHYNLDSLELINFKFEDSVWFEFVNLGEGLILYSCFLEKGLYVISCKALVRNFGTSLRENVSVAIYGGYYSAISLKDNILPYGLNIKGFDEENLKIRRFESWSSHSEYGGFYFEFVSVESQFDITGGILKNTGLRLHNCEIEASVRINSLRANSLSFTGRKSIYGEDIQIWSGSSNSITFNNGTFTSEVKATAVRGVNSLSVHGSVFEDKFIFERKDNNGEVVNVSLPDKIFIQDCSFNNGFEFIGGKSKANLLQINFSERSSGVIDIQETFFQEVTLKGNNFNNSVFLRGCSYDKLTFQHFFNKSQLSFSNNNPHLNDGIPKELKIEHSNLGNTEFYDFDFSIYPIVRVIDSRMDNIFAFGVEWFREKQLYVDEEETSKMKILSQKREIYRQLKLAAEKQSDRITSLFFKAREIQLHQKVLKNKKKPPLSGIADKINNWFEKCSDLASISLGYTNNHGQNWIYPLLWIIGITLAFFPFLMILSDPAITFAWDWSPEGWNLFCKKFGEHSHAIPQLFNPARRLSDLFGNTDSFMLHFLDSFHRIVLAFFIFQIVSAFRKFVK